jgi:hypothetical protein
MIEHRWCDGDRFGGLTARCPRCVLPEAAEFLFEHKFLEAMRRRWSWSATGTA